MQRMFILPGLRNLLDRESAMAYARLLDYEPLIHSRWGYRAPLEEIIVDALRIVETDHDIAALYGFSAGGYNLRRIVARLLPEARSRIKLVVVLGSPLAPEASFRGPWKLVYRVDPIVHGVPNHMAGPKVLLEQAIAEAAKDKPTTEG